MGQDILDSNKLKILTIDKKCYPRQVILFLQVRARPCNGHINSIDLITSQDAPWEQVIHIPCMQ